MSPSSVKGSTHAVDCGDALVALDVHANRFRLIPKGDAAKDDASIALTAPRVRYGVAGDLWLEGMSRSFSSPTAFLVLKAMGCLLVVDLLKKFGLRPIITLVSANWIRRQGKARHDSLTVLAAFFRARRLYFVSTNCLTQAAAFVLMMAFERHASTMVIGVSSHPFRSHAWAEVDGAVATDELDATLVYTPIYRVSVA